MKQWVTSIKAIDPQDGQMKLWSGPHVPGIDRSDAERYCQENGLGYCSIDGELIAEIPCKEGTHEPDWDKMIDYQAPQLN